MKLDANTKRILEKSIWKIETNAKRVLEEYCAENPQHYSTLMDCKEGKQSFRETCTRLGLDPFQTPPQSKPVDTIVNKDSSLRAVPTNLPEKTIVIERIPQAGPLNESLDSKTTHKSKWKARMAPLGFKLKPILANPNKEAQAFDEFVLQSANAKVLIESNPHSKSMLYKLARFADPLNANPVEQLFEFATRGVDTNLLFQCQKIVCEMKTVYMQNVVKNPTSDLVSNQKVVDLDVGNHSDKETSSNPASAFKPLSLPSLRATNVSTQSIGFGIQALNAARPNDTTNSQQQTPIIAPNTPPKSNRLDSSPTQVRFSKRRNEFEQQPVAKFQAIEKTKQANKDIHKEQFESLKVVPGRLFGIESSSYSSETPDSNNSSPKQPGKKDPILDNRLVYQKIPNTNVKDKNQNVTAPVDEEVEARKVPKEPSKFNLKNSIREGLSNISANPEAVTTSRTSDVFADGEEYVSLSSSPDKSKFVATLEPPPVPISPRDLRKSLSRVTESSTTEKSQGKPLTPKSERTISTVAPKIQAISQQQPKISQMTPPQNSNHNVTVPKNNSQPSGTQNNQSISFDRRADIGAEGAPQTTQRYFQPQPNNLQESSPQSFQRHSNSDSQVPSGDNTRQPLSTTQAVFFNVPARAKYNQNTQQIIPADPRKRPTETQQNPNPSKQTISYRITCPMNHQDWPLPPAPPDGFRIRPKVLPLTSNQV